MSNNGNLVLDQLFVGKINHTDKGKDRWMDPNLGKIQ
jgi:hypothetical protein